MATRMEMLMEAQRRGLPIGARDEELLAEATRRGLISATTANTPQPRPEDAALEIDVTNTSSGAAPTQRELEQLRANSPGYQGMTVARNPANDSDFARMVSGQPEQSGVMRDIKMGARSVIQGAGGLFGALGGDAFNHYITPGEQPSYRDAASSFADSIGLPAPQTKQERVMGEVGEGLTGTGLTMGAGGLLGLLRTGATNIAPTATSRLAQFLTAQPKLQVASTVTGSGAQSLTRENGGGQGAQLLAGLAGGMGPGVLSTLGGATTRGALRGLSGETMRGNIDAFSAVGATPSAGQAAGNKRLSGLETLLAGGPTSTGVMDRFGKQQSEQIGSGLQRLADGFSPNASAENAGRAVERGIDTFSRNVRANRKALYWNADRFIPETTPLPLSSTQRVLGSLTMPTPGATATTSGLISPKIKKIADDIAADLAANNGSMPYGAVKALRTKIGEAMDSASPLIPDSAERELRALYKGLSRDMEAAAARLGPDATNAMKRANTYTRTSAERLKDVERVIDREGGPEKVFNAVMAGTKDGGTTLRKVMQSLPPEGQQAVTAAVIKRMGLANAGLQDEAGEVFSAATFLTNWNKVSPEAKRALFDRHGPQFVRNMDRIAKVASNVKENGRTFANAPGTARTALAYGYVLALAQSFATGRVDTFGNLIAAGVGANVMARAFTNPKFVGWLAHTTELPKGAVPAQIALLARVAEESKDEELLEAASAMQAAQAQQEKTDKNPLLQP